MKKKINILIFTEPTSAGVKRHVVDIIRNMHGLDFNFTLVYSLRRADNSFFDELNQIKEMGVKTYETTLTSKPEPISDIYNSLVFARILLRERPDILHCHASKAGFIGRIVGRFILVKTPIFFTPNVISCKLNHSYHWLERIAAPFTSLIIGSSESETKDLNELSFLDKIPKQTVPLCIYEREQKNRDTSLKEKRSINVGACGRITHQKQALLFFKVAHSLQQTHPDFHFKWIGDFHKDDKESIKVKNFLEENQLTNISITGWLENPLEEIEKLDIFLMLSRYESFGYVTADALLAGIPVIGTRTTGTIDLIKDGYNGYLCGNNLNEIRDKLIHLKESENYTYMYLSQNAHKSIKTNYKMDIMISKLSSLYKEWSL